MKTRRIIEIKPLNMLCAFMLISMMKSDYFDTIYAIDIIFNASRVVSLFISAFAVVAYKKSISKVSFLIIVNAMWCIIVSFLYTGAIYPALKKYTPILGVVFIYELYSQDITNLIAVQFKCFEVFIYVNLLTILLFPNGIYTSSTYSYNFFLGFYNNFTYYFIPAIVVSYLYSNMFGNLIRPMFLRIVILISSILTWSGGVLMSVLITYITYYLFRHKTGIFNFLSYWIIQPVFILAILLLDIQNGFVWLIKGMLNKWESFIKRIQVWEWYLEEIKGNLLFGHGVIANQSRINMFSGWKAGHAHNQLLEILYEGGIISLLLFILLIIYIWMTITKLKNEELIIVTSLGFLAWSINATVEPIMAPFLFGMFVLLYYIKALYFESQVELFR